MRPHSLLVPLLIVLFAASAEMGKAQSKGYEVGHRARYIDTPRQFSIKGVTELTKVVIGVDEKGVEITISESNFQWDRRFEELLKKSVGQPPKHGDLSYDATWDRITVFSDIEYYETVLSFLRERFPDSFKTPTKAEQGGADQPATAPESKSEGKENPKPESKVAPR